MRSFRPSLAAAAVAALLASTGASAQFSNTYIFGDSLSDAGQYGAALHDQPGPDVSDVPRAALRPDGDAVVHRRQRLRAGWRAGECALAADPRRRAEPVRGPAGERRSWAQARSIPTRSIRSRVAQTTSWCSRASSAPARSPRRNCRARSCRRRRDLVAQVARLQAAGARYIVVYGLPDVGLTPAAAAQNQQANLTAIATSSTRRSMPASAPPTSR